MRCCSVLLILALSAAGCTDTDPVGIRPEAGTLTTNAAGAITGGKSGDAMPDGTVFPSILPLPTGFAPEGIVTGRGTRFFVGSFSGAVYRGDLRTGEGAVLVAADPGRTALGLAYDRRSDLLFVAGGALGTAYVYDAETGEAVADYPLTTGSGFINDVVVTRTAAYFTDSFNAVLYRLPLGPAGRLPEAGSVEAIPLSGDFELVSDPDFLGINANGIAATPDGKYLIINNMTLGTLYRVDVETGRADRIDLGGASLIWGDGLVLEGRTLYVVQNFLNQVAVVALAPDLLSGTVTETITDPAFHIPATAAAFGDALYVVNAKFDVAPADVPTTPFEVVRISR